MNGWAMHSTPPVRISGSESYTNCPLGRTFGRVRSVLSLFGAPPDASVRLFDCSIRRAGRPMVYSICSWGGGAPHTWGPTVGHSWRTGARRKKKPSFPPPSQPQSSGWVVTLYRRLSSGIPGTFTLQAGISLRFSPWRRRRGTGCRRSCRVLWCGCVISAWHRRRPRGSAFPFCGVVSGGEPCPSPRARPCPLPYPQGAMRGQVGFWAATGPGAFNDPGASTSETVPPEEKSRSDDTGVAD